MQAGCTFESQDDRGNLPLHLATVEGHYECVKFICDSLPPEFRHELLYVTTLLLLRLLVSRLVVSELKNNPSVEIDVLVST